MKHLLLIGAALALNAAGQTEEYQPYCAKSLRPFFGIQGGWISSGYTFQSIFSYGIFESYSPAVRIQSPWGLRGETGFDYSLDDNWRLASSLGFGLYNGYQTYVNSIPFGVVDFGFDIATGPSYHSDNFHGTLYLGAMVQRFSSLSILGMQNNAVVLPSDPTAASDISPITRLEFGYDVESFQFNIAWTHVFGLNQTQNGSIRKVAATSVIAPAMDNIFFGIRYYWSNN